MMRLLALSLPLFLLGCRGPEPVAAAAPTPKAHMNMLQLMRAFPFPHSNVLFDTQSRDPIGPEKKQSMVFSVYRWQDADTYAGWEGVENSALALAESAELLRVPGRQCSNGEVVNVEDADWIRFVDDYKKKSLAAYEAVKTKDQDAIVLASGDLSEACLACHREYRREIPQGDPSQSCIHGPAPSR